MTDFAATRILLLAAEFFAASSLIVAIAWLASYRKTAASRHLVWTAALVSLLALPLLAAIVPGVIRVSYPPPVVETVQAIPLHAVATMIPAPPAPSDVFDFGVSDVAFALLALWALGVALIALRSVLSAVVLHLLKRKSVEAPFESDELPELAAPVNYRLRISQDEHGPLTWGVLRPVVLLPNKSLYWPAERLQAVLKHELAHVARRDGLTQTMALAVVALYWMNPLVWFAARVLRREAEMAADDAVLTSGVTPSEYAGELLEVAREFQTRALSPAMPLYMASPSALEDRVKSVLAPTQQRSGVSSMDVLKGFAVALLATSALAIARPSLAMDAPAPVARDAVAKRALNDVHAPVAAPTPSRRAMVALADATPQADDAAPVAPPDDQPSDADAEAPPAPPAPDAAMPALPAPPAPPTPPSAMNDTVAPVAPGERHMVHEYRDRSGHEVRVEVDGDDRDVDADTAGIQPEIDRAMAEAHRAMADAKQQRAEARRAIDEARPQIAIALAQARKAMSQIDVAKIQAEVDRALAKAQRDIDRGGKSRIVIEKHVHDDGDDEAPDSN